MKMVDTKLQTHRNAINLANGLDVLRDWKIDLLKLEFGSAFEPDGDTIVGPASFYLDVLGEPNGHSKAILRELQTIFGHYSGEVEAALQSANPAIATRTEKFLEQFEKVTGESFPNVTGILREQARLVIRRGAINNREEWRAMREICDDLSQAVLSTAELSKLKILTVEFEAKA